MARLLRILLPKFSGESYFVGMIESKDSNITVFVTELTEEAQDNKTNYYREEETIYGYLGYHSPERNPARTNYIELNSDYEVIKLYINNSVKAVKNCILILYDHNNLKQSQIGMKPSDITDYVSKLHSLIQEDSCNLAYNPERLRFQWPGWVTSSMSTQLLLCYLNLLHWLYVSALRQRKFQIKQLNYMIALIMDLALGYLLLSLISQYDIELSSILMGILEKLVNSLHSLLKWLMGAPAGLKLNKAFNNMLGKYFSYHIQLWWLFLDVSSDKLDLVLQGYRWLGYLGASFQAAMVCDMICVATFHSYCIYVYAARLFNIQISGLTALMRLFFGRKRNPLRGGIDSCEYSNQQLFVGTVAFTVLLLLLPTTAMYYIVFTLFRLLSLSLQFALAKMIQHVHTMPLYVTMLWLLRSPKVAGNILMEVVDSKENTPLVLNLKLQTKSLGELIKFVKPPVEMCKPAAWTNALSNIFTGKPIV